MPSRPPEPTQHVCPQGNGQTHHLTPMGPMSHRVMRCIWCGLSESTLRALIEIEGFDTEPETRRG